jgi:tRNA A-37 threonylcarbamoyl transferase component Bud32
MSYTTVGLLGRGGMAVVELAVDGSGRHVARKRVAISGSAQQIEAARRRIRREADVLSTLRHPAIVPLLDIDEEGDDLVLVLPYLPGGTLADRVAARGPMPFHEVEQLADCLLAGLAVAHRQGIVHRDLKPANILFGADGSPAISDFGVATARDVTPGLTVAGFAVGTPGYMAPEQARGERAGPAADVFALGATLAFALTGEGPFGPGPPDTLMWRASRGRVAALPRSVPRHLRKRLTAMLDPDPAKRPTAAAAAGGAAGTEVRTASVQARRPMRAVVYCTQLAVAVALGGLVAFFATRPSSSQHAAAAPTTVPCVSLPYEPCGQPLVAPFTDGRQCVADHADYDRDPSNGCEAAPDTVDGTLLAQDRPIKANLVPATDVDSYPVHITDRFQLFCDGSLRVRLTAPAGVADRVEVIRNGKVLARATSTDGEPATAVARDPDCFHDDSGLVTVRVTSVSGQSAANYRLEETGSF